MSLPRALLALSLAACASSDITLRPSDPAEPTGPEPSSPADPSDPVDPTEPVASALLELAFFQSVEIPVWVAPDALPNEARTAPLVAGKDAVVRALVEAGDTLAVDVTSGGVTETFTGFGSGALVATVPADALTLDATYVARVLSGDDEVARFPATGTAALGAVETGPLRLRLVPYEVDGFVPDTSAAVVDGLREALLAAYPITDVEIDVAPVQAWTEPFDLGDILYDVGVLQETAMFAGEVDWDVYHYAMVTGVASRDEWTGPTGTSEDGGSEPLVRAYFAAGAAFGDAKAEGTLLHEFGHVHGLEHSPCDGEADVDPNYPYPDGSIGVEGYDRRTATFLPDDTKDLMTYCDPRWVSDYGVGKIAEHVANAQDYAGFQ